jgi:hypothetical protein
MDEATRRRVRDWQHAGPALAADRRRRLTDLTVEEAREHAEELLDLAVALPRKQDRTGLVEQQRVFARVER